MSFINYINEMKEMDSIVGMIGAGILALFLLFIIFKMLGGMRRGTWRQLVRTLATLAAAVVSFVAGVIISNKIIGSLDVQNLESFILEIEAASPEAGEMVRNVISAIDTEMIEYILLLPATIIIIPIVTTVLFLVINLVFKIIRAILIKILKFKKAKNNTQRLGGALLAAVEFIIWTTMVLLPVTSLITLADAAYTEAMNASTGNERAALVETYDEYLYPFTNNPTFTFVENLGGNAMANGIATVKIHGEKTNMRDEVLAVSHAIIVDVGALKGADFTALNPDQQAALSSITETLANSPFMSRILVSLMNTVPTVYESGLIPLDFGGDFAEIIDSFMSFLTSVECETLGEDLCTLEDFYFGFCNSGLLSAISDGEDIMQFVSEDYRGDRHILGMVNALSGNPRTKGIVDSLYNMVLNAAFSGSNDNENADQPGNENDGPVEALPQISITDVKEGLNNIVSVKKENYETEEEYREVLSETISTTLNDTVGVEIEEETANEIADYVDENFSEQLGELTDQEFNELIFEVIDIYQSYLNGEEINPDDLENLIPPQE